MTETKTSTATPSQSSSPTQSTTLTGTPSESQAISSTTSLSFTRTQSGSPSYSQTPTTSLRPFELQLEQMDPAMRLRHGDPNSDSVIVLSDSCSPAEFVVSISRCPSPNQGTAALVSCSTTTIGVSAACTPYVAVAFRGISNSGNTATGSVVCADMTPSATGHIPLPIIVTVGATYGTAGCTTMLVCELFDGPTSIGRSIRPLSLTPTRWPRWIDAIAVMPGSALMRSALLKSTVNASGHLLASCRYILAAGCSLVETMQSPVLMLAAAQAVWGVAALPLVVGSSPLPFSLSLAGITWVILRGAVQGSFSNATQITLGNVNCSMLAISTDGAWILVATPSPKAICGFDTVGCGYVALAVSNVDSGNEATWAVAEAAGVTSSAAGGIGNVSYRGARLVCPPHCPFASGDALPFPLDDTLAPALGSALMPTMGSGLPRPVVAPTATSEGIYLFASCTQTSLYTDPLTGSCSNESDPASYLCAYGAESSCSVCPDNALCPGGYRLWPRTGAWEASDARGFTVFDCPPPALERCAGWNVTSGSTQCGSPYLQGSYLCSACASGYALSSDGTCEACPVIASMWDRYRVLLMIIAALLGIVSLVYAVLLLLVRMVGGSITGGAMRAINLGVWGFATIQVFANAAALPSPTLPSSIRSFYDIVSVLQLQGVVLSSECTHSYPFEVEATAMSLAVLSWLVTVWLYRFASSKKARAIGKVTLKIAIILYPIVTTKALRLVNCTTVSVVATTAVRLDGGAKFTSVDVVSLPVLTYNPAFVCWSGSHAPMGYLALVVLGVFVAGMPIITLWWMWRDPWLQYTADLDKKRLQRHKAEGSVLSTRNSLRTESCVVALLCCSRSSLLRENTVPATFTASPIVKLMRRGHLHDVNNIPAPVAGSSLLSLNSTAPAELPEPMPDALLTDSVHRPEVWYQRHIELGLLLVLSAYRALLPRPATLVEALTKGSIIGAAITASLVHLIVANPFFPTERWMGWVRAALLVDALLCTLINAAVASIDAGFVNFTLIEILARGPPILFAACCVTLLVLVGGFSWHMYTAAITEQRAQCDESDRRDLRRPIDLSASPVKHMNSIEDSIIDVQQHFMNPMTQQPDVHADPTAFAAVQSGRGGLKRSRRGPPRSARAAARTLLSQTATAADLDASCAELAALPPSELRSVGPALLPKLADALLTSLRHDGVGNGVGAAVALWRTICTLTDHCVDDECITSLVSMGVPQALAASIRDARKDTRVASHAVWLLGNLAAVNAGAGAAFACAGGVPSLVALIQWGAEGVNSDNDIMMQALVTATSLARQSDGAVAATLVNAGSVGSAVRIIQAAARIDEVSGSETLHGMDSAPLACPHVGHVLGSCDFLYSLLACDAPVARAAALEAFCAPSCGGAVALAELCASNRADADADVAAAAARVLRAAVSAGGQGVLTEAQGMRGRTRALFAILSAFQGTSSSNLERVAQVKSP